ncbi:MAG: tRNA guanosine(34) transglycosylase Tgt [Patescibacteria group bacterium]
MKSPITFEILKESTDSLARVGVIHTPHGDIQTPSFAVVGTKATVKALTSKQLNDINPEVLLANTYHLYLKPGSEILKKAGGLNKFANWSKPTMTDSGGFQVFSLGKAFGKNISKFTDEGGENEENKRMEKTPYATIGEDGVAFRSHIDGSDHFLTPEKSIEIQHNIGADIIIAFDEPTSPNDPIEYQKEALERTHRWAKRCVEYHKSKPNAETQALYGVVQGGKFPDLRKESAEYISSLDFDGFAIGGSYNKNDIGAVVNIVNSILPKNKPRHLLGIGEPLDLFDGIEAGCDTFDCVMPTRNARNGSILTKNGKINITNTKFREDFGPLEEGCGCETCTTYTRAYIAHLFHSDELLSNTLTSIHNVHFLVNLVRNIRNSILEGNYESFKKSFIEEYSK